MKAHIFDTDALLSVSPAALRAYLVFEGWKNAGEFGSRGQIFQNETVAGRGFEVLVPTIQRVADYSLTVSRVVQSLSEFEERDELSIWRDLAHSDRDVVRVRAPEAEKDGSITVEAGVEVVVQARDLLNAAACSAIDARPVFRMGKVQDAVEYMKRVRLGQTEQSSFVVALLAPVPPALTPSPQLTLWEAMEDEPYERRVTRILRSALEAAQKAIEESNKGNGKAAFDAAVALGVSANLCEAVASIIERGSGAELSVTWARTRPTPISRSVSKFVVADAEILREAARQFRMDEPKADYPVFGVITKLGREEDEYDGTATIKTLLDGKRRSVSVYFAKEQFEKAIDAFERKLPVSLVGNLELHGARWRLHEPRHFMTLDPNDNESAETP